MTPEKHEPNTFQVNASYKSARNTKLARALYKHISWGTYDRFAAHRWALKVISANPSSPAELAAVLTNYDRMVEAAVRKYEAVPTERRRIDAAFAAYTSWKAEKQEDAA